MDEITMNAAQLMTSYGALGVVTLYFMIKDWKLNKAIEESLNKLTLAINLLAGKAIDNE